MCRTGIGLLLLLLLLGCPHLFGGSHLQTQYAQNSGEHHAHATPMVPMALHAVCALCGIVPVLMMPRRMNSAAIEPWAVPLSERVDGWSQAPPAPPPRLTIQS